MPFGNFHDRALASRRYNLKFVDESSYTREAEPEASRCRKTVAKSKVNVWNAGPAVTRNNGYASPMRIVERLQDNLSLFGIRHNVTRQLRNCGGNQCAIHRGETGLGSQQSALLTSKDDVLV